MDAPNKVSVDELAREKLTTQVVDAIDAMVEEADFGVYVGVKNGKFTTKVQVQLPLKRMLILVGAAILLWQFAPDLYSLIPLLMALLSKA